MMIYRASLLVLVLALSACDSEPKPEPKPAKVETSQPQAARPAPAPERKPQAAAPATKPAVKAPVATAPVATPSPKPAVKKPVATVKAPPVAEPIPDIELDLSVPAEMLEPPALVDSDDIPSDSLLPPLFGGEPDDNFQLNGSLITDEHSKKNYIDSVEGAQLQFEFKR